eukprot:SAG11_NODE_544_length_8629_cov_3.550229_9_plen_59_part_00
MHSFERQAVNPESLPASLCYKIHTQRTTDSVDVEPSCLDNYANALRCLHDFHVYFDAF